MNWSALKLLFVHEMRMLLRSRRTIVTSVVLPLIMMPVMIMGSTLRAEQQESRVEETTFEYAVTGPLGRSSPQSDQAIQGRTGIQGVSNP